MQKSISLLESSCSCFKQFWSMFSNTYFFSRSFWYMISEMCWEINALTIWRKFSWNSIRIFKNKKSKDIDNYSTSFTEDLRQHSLSSIDLTSMLKQSFHKTDSYIITTSSDIISQNILAFIVNFIEFLDIKSIFSSS